MGQILGECRFLFDMLQKWRRIFVRPAGTRQNGGRREKQKKALALSLRQGSHFNPQCRRLRGTKIKDLDVVRAEEYTVTTRLRTWYDLYAKPNIRH